MPLGRGYREAQLVQLLWRCCGWGGAGYICGPDHHQAAHQGEAPVGLDPENVRVDLYICGPDPHQAAHRGEALMGLDPEKASGICGPGGGHALDSVTMPCTTLAIALETAKVLRAFIARITRIVLVLVQGLSKARSTALAQAFA